MGSGARNREREGRRALARRCIGLISSCCALSMLTGCGTSPGQPAGTIGRGVSGGSASGTSGGGTTGSGGATTTGGIQIDDSLADCPSGLIELKSTIFDACDALSGKPSNPITTPVEVTDRLDPNLTATTNASGAFYFCLDGGTSVEATVSSPAFEKTLVAPIEAQFTAIMPSLTLFCTGFIDGELPSVVAIDDTAAAVAVSILPTSLLDSPSCPSQTRGWELSLVQGDGGLVDAGVFYIQGTEFGAGATRTDDTGFAVFVNVDPRLGSVQILGHFAGVDCPNLDTALQFTGEVPLQSGYLTYSPFVP